MKRVLSIVLLIIIIGCTYQPLIIPKESRGKLTTEDNLSISYIYNKVNSDKAVVLLHMLNRNKNDWNTFALKLNQNNFSTLAIDLRGHGESDGDWESFSEEGFNNMILDVKSAKEFLDQENYSEVYIVGGSIGANIALRYAANDSSIKKVVLLSPSVIYRGITTLDILNDYKGKMLIATGSRDIQSYEGSQQLNQLFEGKKELLVYNTGIHGIILLLNYNELNNKVIEFLKD